MELFSCFSSVKQLSNFTLFAPKTFVMLMLKFTSLRTFWYQVSPPLASASCDFNPLKMPTPSKIRKIFPKNF